ncbi:APC family permease [Tetragenococcus halophilus]|uniref:APC family permease n=1 Tax=Tetragenococcus halophilus TaxID=51669 RepID=UPI000CAD34E0|nr:amino acid permease [Tetragenococcus halophilus]MCO8285159.1 amino acid permease [Tetragenococcus halophilus]GBD66195.1 putative amino acid permease [Tetragenococcus halophilus subsp. halophilus]GBD78211.1 putative amino acid permease [Tetragenococcus halophilus subsp. halophilus]
MEIFRKRPIEKNSFNTLKRELKLKDLIMLGIGAIIGTGIFVVTGQASADYAGPASMISFIIAALVVILNGICFAEFASRVPVSGGPYSYMYVVFGELTAWIAGWLLICEYMLAVSTVASGWSGYFQGFLSNWGIQLPQALTAGYNPEEGTYIDLIAALIMILVTLWVTQEAKKALRLNNAMVWVKFAVIILFVAIGIFFIQPDNWQPYMPYGTQGIFNGAALVFFAFLGFDSISMAAEEVENPQKDVPRGIIGSIIIATILYVVVTLVLTGMVPFSQLGVQDPVAFAMRYIDQGFIGSVISVGTILTLLTVTISMLYSLARLIYSISKDGLLPKYLQQIDEKRRTPKNATFVAGAIGLFFAAAFPLNILAELTNITALACLALMALGVIRLRKMLGKPSKDEFKVPLVPLLPIISVLSCIFLMLQLDKLTWTVFIITLVLGLAIYFGYGYQHSDLNEKKS